MATFPLKLPALRVQQPLGDFYVVAIDAATLRTITFRDPTRIDQVNKKTYWYSLLGAQRQESIPRAKQIAKYINTVEAAFPNSIILAANYINHGEFQEDENTRWYVEERDRSLFQLVIPTPEKMASIIDGQHRLLGFDYCDKERLGMELLCSVYMDLPHAYQAYLFATININQRKVNKSLAYEQFGYNLDDEQKDGWAPDKIAVYFSRKLNLDSNSPFYGHIKIAPLNADILFASKSKSEWQVSTACIVESIAKLISQTPKTDRDILHTKTVGARSRSMLKKDSSPLRSLYLTSKDDEIYRLIITYFNSVKERLWVSASETSYIRKTVGIQALFEVFRVIVDRYGVEEAEKRISSILRASSSVDFSDPAYQASGKGRVRIKNTLLLYPALLSKDELPSGDAALYAEILKKYPRQLVKN